MDHKDKQILFNEFRDKWGDELLDKVYGAMNLLCGYPPLTWDLRDNKKFDNKEGFYEHQLEWISLIAQFDHPMEQKFFKNHWLSLQKDSYDYFIDISSDSLRLIEINFVATDNYAWFYHIVCEDLNALFLDANNENLDFRKFMMDYEKRKVQEYIAFSKSLGRKA